MNEFRKKILKVNLPRKHKISNSFGTYDVYKWIRKNKWMDIGRPITEHLFYRIIREMNKKLALTLIDGKDLILPCGMGVVEVRKYFPKIKIVNGKVKENLPIDWDRTLKLWEEDEECHTKKTLVKAEEQTVFKIKYNKTSASYKNKCFYQFFPNRNIKVKLKEAIKNNQFDAFYV